MKAKLNHLISSFCLIAALAATGCSDEHEYALEHSYYNDLALKINNVDKKNVLSVKLADETYPLSVDVVSEALHFGPEAYIYEVGDNRIAKVDYNGMLTLLKAGETDLTVKYRGNKAISVGCKLKVVASTIRNVVVNSESIYVKLNETVDLNEYVTVLPWSADTKALDYTVKQGYEGIVEITEGTIVRGLNRGKAVIEARSTDGLNVTKDINLEVVVEGEIPITEIRVDREEIAQRVLNVGNEIDLASFVTVLPAEASDKELKYEVVSGAECVSITDGMLKTIAVGEAEIKISPVNEEVNQIAPVILQIKVVWFERTSWSVGTTVTYANGNNYVPDNDAGNGKPEKLVDGDTSTFLMMVKPGKPAYNGHQHPEGAEFGFIIDLGDEQEFNCFKWQHRIANSAQNPLAFEAFAIKISVSGDKQSFAVIADNVNIKVNSREPAELELIKDVPLSKCRYIKVEYLDWDKNAGTNVCVAEFNVGKK